MIEYIDLISFFNSIKDTFINATDMQIAINDMVFNFNQIVINQCGIGIYNKNGEDLNKHPIFGISINFPYGAHKNQRQLQGGGAHGPLQGVSHVYGPTPTIKSTHGRTQLQEPIPATGAHICTNLRHRGSHMKSAAAIWPVHESNTAVPVHTCTITHTRT
jgi:hypothetical protein